MRAPNLHSHRLFVIALAVLATFSVACSPDSDALPGFTADDIERSARAEPLPTLTAEQETLLKVGDVDFRTCTALVGQQDVTDAADGTDILLRDALDRFNLGVPGDATRRGIVSSCVLEYRERPFDGEPGTTMTITSLAFETEDEADAQRRRLLASSRTILLNLEPDATFRDGPLGEETFQLVANADRLSSMIGFRVRNTFTQLSTTVSEDGSFVISPENLLSLARIVRANLEAGQ